MTDSKSAPRAVRFVVTATILVALAASLAIFLLGQWAKGSARAETELAKLAGSLHALSAGEWESITHRSVDPRTEEVVASLTGSADQIRGALARTRPGKDLDALNATYSAYIKAMNREFALIKAAGQSAGKSAKSINASGMQAADGRALCCTMARRTPTVTYTSGTR